MLSVGMLGVIMLNVVMLSVVAPYSQYFIIFGFQGPDKLQCYINHQAGKACQGQTIKTKTKILIIGKVF